MNPIPALAATRVETGATAQDAAWVRQEWIKCAQAPAYFVCTYVQIETGTAAGWAPFALWPAQQEVLQRMVHERLLVILKARQLGMTWLALAYALWRMLLAAPATVLLFSLREVEAVELLGRLRGMYSRLPVWLQARQVCQAERTGWRLSNGSRALAFSTRAGRSYTGTLALVDEADYIPELATFLNGVKPTVDAGGQLFLISTSDKRRPVSVFKNLFRAAVQNQRSTTQDTESHREQKVGRKEGNAMSIADEVISASGTLCTSVPSVVRSGAGDYRAVFLPWHARPGRTPAWYARTKAEMAAQRGTDDDFLAEYPATPEEALAPVQQDRRVPYGWLQGVVEFLPAVVAGPALPGLTVYVPPAAGRRYVIGADPAEGTPHSDASAACVLEADQWAEVATLVGALEPGAFAAALAQLAFYYHAADVLVERNNHGHAVIHALQADGRVRVLAGYDGRPGWLSNVKGKPLLYDAVAEVVRAGGCRVRSGETAAQLASIAASTLRAPAGLHDDRADAFALAVAALAYGNGGGEPSTVAPAVDPLTAMDRSAGW
jgi:hypothetical protein